MLLSVDALRLAGSCSLQGRTGEARDRDGRTSLLKMGEAYERPGTEEHVICVTWCVAVAVDPAHFSNFIHAK